MDSKKKSLQPIKRKASAMIDTGMRGAASPTIIDDKCSMEQISATRDKKNKKKPLVKIEEVGDTILISPPYLISGHDH